MRVAALAREDVVQVAAGKEHTVAVTSAGEVWTWGAEHSGQLGRELEWEDDAPGKVVDGLKDEHVVHVAAGSYHTVVVTSTGALWTWGDCGYGELGHGPERDDPETGYPRRVEALNHVFVVAADAGSGITAAITSLGELYMFGDITGTELDEGDPRGVYKPTKSWQIDTITGRWKPIEQVTAAAAPTADDEEVIDADGSGPVAPVFPTESLWPGFSAQYKSSK
jgi:alpha-tubulin suppressor-like RCC1 family protein